MPDILLAIEKLNDSIKFINVKYDEIYYKTLTHPNSICCAFLINPLIPLRSVAVTHS